MHARPSLLESRQSQGCNTVKFAGFAQAFSLSRRIVQRKLQARVALDSAVSSNGLKTTHHLNSSDKVYKYKREF